MYAEKIANMQTENGDMNSVTWRICNMQVHHCRSGTQAEMERIHSHAILASVLENTHTYPTGKSTLYISIFHKCMQINLNKLKHDATLHWPLYISYMQLCRSILSNMHDTRNRQHLCHPSKM